jgi:hypothetical protein
MNIRHVLWLMAFIGVIALSGHNVVARPITTHVIASGITDPGYPDAVGLSQ